MLLKKTEALPPKRPVKPELRIDGLEKPVASEAVKHQFHGADRTIGWDPWVSKALANLEGGCMTTRKKQPNGSSFEQRECVQQVLTIRPLIKRLLPGSRNSFDAFISSKYHADCNTSRRVVSSYHCICLHSFF